jgi:outer membrane protein OmpA-like peptidoglycan-associated protein
MFVAGSQRGLFLSCLGVGVGCLLLLDFCFAPAAIAVEGEAGAHPPDRATSDPRPSVAKNASASVDAPAASAVRVVLDPAARVPTIVARFESEAKEPADDAAIRALARAMIEDHSVKVVLEGHSDTRGGDDFNHEISLRRADWVKSRLVELGVSGDRIETVGLGATRPLRSDEPDAQSVNRRVEVRWVGR